MPESPDNSIQEFRWQSLPEFSEFLNRLGKHGIRSWPESPDELRSELEAMRLDPEADIALLRSGTSLCGYALTLAELDIDRIVASVASVGNGAIGTRKLIDFVVGRANDAGASMIHIPVRGSPVDPLDQLVASGFSKVAVNLELTLGREDAADMVDTDLNDGFSIRPMRSMAEALLLTSVQNTAFENHWGFSKNTAEEVMTRLELPVTGPEHVLFAESLEGDIAGYIWTALEWHDDHTCGRIWMTGVLPEFRSMGLGWALVNAGVKHLFAEGAADVHLEVVEDNAAAVRIYEGIGFKRYGQTTWYEKKV